MYFAVTMFNPTSAWDVSLEAKWCTIIFSFFSPGFLVFSSLILLLGVELFIYCIKRSMFVVVLLLDDVFIPHIHVPKIGMT